MQLNAAFLSPHRIVIGGIDFSQDRLVRALHAELRECQQRLGTDSEAPDDLARARALAHAINNRIQIAYLLRVADAA